MFQTVYIKFRVVMVESRDESLPKIPCIAVIIDVPCKCHIKFILVCLERKTLKSAIMYCFTLYISYVALYCCYTACLL